MHTYIRDKKDHHSSTEFSRMTCKVFYGRKHLPFTCIVGENYLKRCYLVICKGEKVLRLDSLQQIRCREDEFFSITLWFFFFLVGICVNRISIDQNIINVIKKALARSEAQTKFLDKWILPGINERKRGSRSTTLFYFNIGIMNKRKRVIFYILG